MIASSHERQLQRQEINKGDRRNRRAQHRGQQWVACKPSVMAGKRDDSDWNIRSIILV